MSNHLQSSQSHKDLSFQILNQTKNTSLADNGLLANTFWTRMKGLLGRKKLFKDEALIITKCNSIHMFFMEFSIDVIFLNKENYVVGIVNDIKPNRLSAIYWKANYAIELPVGVISSSKTSVGDHIVIKKKDK